MNSNADFRSKFYEGYFSRQASRSGNTDLSLKIRDDHFRYADEILPHLPSNKNARITELGCGYGSLLLFLKEHGYTAKGLDVSEEQVQKAGELGVEAEVADIVAWSFSGDADQDVVLAIDLIEHFDKPELYDLICALKNRLKPGGKIICRTPNMDAIRPTEYAFGDFTHGALLNPSSATQLFLSAGFDKVKVHASSVKVRGAKNFFRSILWGAFTLQEKLKLFASGRSTKGMIVTPNLVIVAEK